MAKNRVLCALGLLLLVGCFPIELDVNKEGHLLVTRQEGFFVVDPSSKKVKLIQKATEGAEPSYARFSPDGKQVLTVSKSGFQTFDFSLVTVANGKAKQIFQVDSAANARFSPDGKYIAVVAGSADDDPEFKSKVPELHLVTTATGNAKKVVSKIGTNIQWLADSKTIVLLEAKSKEGDVGFAGTVSTLDVATGKLSAKAAVIVNQQFAFDVSPDGKKAVFTAFAAGKVGGKLEKGENGSEDLYELTLATGAAKNLKIQPKYAYYSPNGKSMLLAMPSEGFSFDSVQLQIADANDVTKSTELCTASYPLALGGEGAVRAGWISDKSIYYFVERKVYGTTGKSLQLLTIGTDGSKPTLLQPAIDSAAFE
ncbi:MAG TPA: hypothetical protein VGM98_01365 [Schlesneria sp.]